MPTEFTAQEARERIAALERKNYDLAQRCLRRGVELAQVRGDNEILIRQRDSWLSECMAERASADARAERIATLERELAETKAENQRLAEQEYTAVEALKACQCENCTRLMPSVDAGAKVDATRLQREQLAVSRIYISKLERELNEAEQELEERPGADWTAFDRMEAGTVARNRIEALLRKIAASEEPVVFADWGFDAYDRSVELFNVKVGWHPTPHLEALRGLGIALTFVNYQDGSAKSWRTDRESEGRSCSHKQSGSQRIAALECELAAVKAGNENLHALLKDRDYIRELAALHAREGAEHGE